MNIIENATFYDFILIIYVITFITIDLSLKLQKILI